MTSLPPAGGYAPGPAHAAACAAVLQRVRDEGLQQVRVAWADLHGHFRGKTVVCSEGALAAALHGGIGMVSTLLLKDSGDRTAFRIFEPDGLGATLSEAGFGAANNVLLRPDPASFTTLPWAPGTGWLRAEAFWETWEGDRAVAVDPRRVLQRALDELQAEGYTLRCGLELEFHIHRIVDDGLASAAPEGTEPGDAPAVRHTHPGWLLLGEAHADLLDEAFAIVRHTALGLGLPLRSLEIEMGPSQVEAVFAPTDALSAADQLLQFRNGVRQALRRAGYHASFACKPPLAGSVASGWHLHQSLQGADGCNAFTRPRPAPHRVAPGPSTPAGAAAACSDARQCLSDTGAHWLAGLLAHARGMTALCAPSIPAYARYRGSVMAPTAAVWGHDHRGALLRVVGGPGDAATRIENRLAEPAANPYLAIAAQVHAGLHGLRQRLPAPPAAAAAEAPGSPAHPLLPTSLAEALQAFAEDSVLGQGLGAAVCDIVLAVRRQELARHAQAADPAAWERREYFSRT